MNVWFDERPRDDAGTGAPVARMAALAHGAAPRARTTQVRTGAMGRQSARASVSLVHLGRRDASALMPDADADYSLPS
jgi:hypothetical protein